MTRPTVGRLRVDGATLHYEVRGRGPLLLLIPGGTGGAAAFDGVADLLADDYTVASYDPRGLSRSPLDDPEARQRVNQHADDAFRLLELLSPGAPARVAGCSSGAIVALHLLVTHPERTERIVAHEPPVVEALPDAAEHRALLARVQDTFRREGLMPAAAVFAAGLRRPDQPQTGPGRSETSPGSDVPGDTGAPGDAGAATPVAAAAAEGPVGPGEVPSVTELPPQAAARAERTMADMPYFLGRIVPSFMAYAPDVDRLRALSDRLVLAAGADSHGELPYRPAAFLAEQFGTELVLFPGGHTGLTTHPAEFGELLRKVLGA
ncbi:alpha/beta fold hydrolase [Nonomuraea jiangxiensis]|uniref:Alpha/beta hydrolase fold n=1 Tax=Nonomuraea jiangxiensis TaxID=633440 RepID=A0A1G8JS34_9ACTN|nr:alpha/beta hydrolase [Nonomuraea jiangxiensis]SDI33975.1 alpha/beta hydrolase fold [Nonomuraea jiangxiensis]